MTFIIIYYIIGVLVSSYMIHYYRYKLNHQPKQTDALMGLIGPWIWPVQLINWYRDLYFKKESKSPQKLVRDYLHNKCKEGDTKICGDKNELRKLYCLKVFEELKEIKDSNYEDIKEFADLAQVVISFAKIEGFSYEDLSSARLDKAGKKGEFSNIILTKLNPNNPSNEIYFL